MKPQRHSIDGFIPRRAGSQLGERHFEQPTRGVYPRHMTRPQANQPSQPNRRQATTGLQQSASQIHSGQLPAVPVPTNGGGLTRRDIDESLNSIPADEPTKPKKRRWYHFGKKRRGIPLTKKQRIIRWAVITAVVVLVIAGGWLGYTFLKASGNIFKGNLFGLIQNQPLKMDENGRSNILIMGTSEDDPGHGGAYLTDSMMIVSIDQNNKTAAMFSIPRDLYVEYGRACNSGFQGKINEYFNCVNSDHTGPAAEEERLRETRKFVGDIFGMNIQYAVHVNHTVIKEAVDAVGGINVNIQGSNGAPGVLDRNFDWRCNYECYLVKYDNGVHHLDGKHALFLAMARGDTAPTYGLGNSNFDREKNQQKILIALKEKAVSAGTLTDITKVTALIDSLGNNLRTNFQTSEIRTLMQLGTEIPVSSIKTISLYEDDNALVTSGNYNGASVVMPVAGIFNYSEIRSFLNQKFSTNPVTREGASIAVLNGAGVAGLAQDQADELASKGFVIGTIGNAPAGDYADIEVYQIGDGMNATKAKLESLFGVTVQTTAPPVVVAEGTDFVVIVGKDLSAN